MLLPGRTRVQPCVRMRFRPVMASRSACVPVPDEVGRGPAALRARPLVVRVLPNPHRRPLRPEAVTGRDAGRRVPGAVPTVQSLSPNHALTSCPVPAPGIRAERRPPAGERPRARYWGFDARPESRVGRRFAGCLCRRSTTPMTRKPNCLARSATRGIRWCARIPPWPVKRTNSPGSNARVASGRVWTVTPSRPDYASRDARCCVVAATCKANGVTARLHVRRRQRTGRAGRGRHVAFLPGTVPCLGR